MTSPAIVKTNLVLDLGRLIRYVNQIVANRSILRAYMYEVTCFPCGIRERFAEEDEAVVNAYNHERV